MSFHIGVVTGFNISILRMKELIFREVKGVGLGSTLCGQLMLEAGQEARFPNSYLETIINVPNYLYKQMS